MLLFPNCICFSLVLKVKAWHALTHNICSFWPLVLSFLTYIQNSKKLADTLPKEILLMSHFLARILCSPLGPEEKRLYNLQRLVLNLPPGAGVGRLSTKQSCSTVCKTEEQDAVGKANSRVGPVLFKTSPWSRLVDNTKLTDCWLDISCYFMEQKIAKDYHLLLDSKQQNEEVAYTIM